MDGGWVTWTGSPGIGWPIILADRPFLLEPLLQPLSPASIPLTAIIDPALAPNWRILRRVVEDRGDWLSIAFPVIYENCIGSVIG
tara:strand:- start:1410 stop:1664 length:255 start_codon:yes stop_codon:yes gene_type:complete